MCDAAETVTPGRQRFCRVAFIPHAPDGSDGHGCSCDQPPGHVPVTKHHCPDCDVWWSLRSEQGDAAAPEQKPEVGELTIAICDIEGHAPHAARVTIDYGLQVTSFCLPPRHAAFLGGVLASGELAEAKADRDDYAARLKAADQGWTRLSVERDRLREALEDIGVLAANAPEDGDSFGVLEEIAMRVAAVGVPDSAPGTPPRAPAVTAQALAAVLADKRILVKVGNGTETRTVANPNVLAVQLLTAIDPRLTDGPQPGGAS